MMTIRRARTLPAPVVAAAPTDVTTRPGQQAEVRLVDGTQVTLSPASKLTYPSDFGQRERTVVLDGEAYFTVVHDPARPFRVESAHGVAEDLGTAFVIRARGTSALQVVVTEGAVVLRPRPRPAGDTDSLVLTRGQLGRVLPDGELTFRSRVDTAGYLAWTRGELVFEDTPLAEVAAELSRWYAADVRVARPGLAGRRFSGRFERKSLDEAVKLVAAVADVSARRIDAGWIFH
jgi:transmembrane sensor